MKKILLNEKEFNNLVNLLENYVKLYQLDISRQSKNVEEIIEILNRLNIDGKASKIDIEDFKCPKCGNNYLIPEELSNIKHLDAIGVKKEDEHFMHGYCSEKCDSEEPQLKNNDEGKDG
jgi:hypothetical protein